MTAEPIRILFFEAENRIDVCGRDERTGKVYADGSGLVTWVAQIAADYPLDSEIEFRWRPDGPISFVSPKTLRRWVEIAAERKNPLAMKVLGRDAFDDATKDVAGAFA